MARYVPALACLVLLVPIWVLDFRPANLRTDGPRWNEQVDRAAVACKPHPEGKAILQISPPGWKVVLPCADVS